LAANTESDSMKLEYAAELQLLVNSVAASINQKAVASLQAQGIKITTARVLVSLIGHNRIRCAALAKLVGMEATALSHLLRAMVQQGFIVRERVDNDNRAVEVRLTPLGEEMAKLSESAFSRQGELLLKGFSSEELALLKQSLTRLHDNARVKKVASAR
jgi:DNA-binding MarR family transcriptional regulator